MARPECDGTHTEVDFNWANCSRGTVQCPNCQREQKLTEAQQRKGAGSVTIRRHSAPREE